MKLSDLARGTTYRITADDVDARMLVVRPGVMPTVILYGRVQDFLLEDESPPTYVQLIGWAPFDPDPETFELFVTDEQPRMAFLVGLCNTGQDNRVMTLACCPAIRLE